MLVYHEIAPKALHSTLQHGLKRTSRGAKGNNPIIITTDQFLDALCPADLQQRGLSRDNTIYAYLQIDEGIVDITDGATKNTRSFIKNSDQITLCLTVDPARCYVSDLDQYDRVKQGIEQGIPPSSLTQLGVSYWEAIVPLASFSPGSITRPEIMITYDIPRAKIAVAG